MKRIFTAAFVLLIAGSLPFNLALGQEKKTEKKIKVVVTDKDGEKVLLDTVFTGEDLPEDIELEDGRMVLIAKNGEKTEWSVKSSSSEPRIMVFSGSDENDSVIEKKVIITSKSEGDKEWKEEDGKTLRIMVKKDNESSSDMSNYVIAKDGIVVTVECEDEKKAQELIREIEKLLGKK